MTLRVTPTQAGAKKRVEAIHTAGRDLLAEIGRDRLTTAAVAMRAGMSIGTFYRYYPDRIALLEAIQPLHQSPELGVWLVEDRRGNIRGLFATEEIAEAHVELLLEQTREARQLAEALVSDISMMGMSINMPALYRVVFEPIRTTPYALPASAEGTNSL